MHMQFFSFCNLSRQVIAKSLKYHSSDYGKPAPQNMGLLNDISRQKVVTLLIHSKNQPKTTMGDLEAFCSSKLHRGVT